MGSARARVDARGCLCGFCRMLTGGGLARAAARAAVSGAVGSPKPGGRVGEDGLLTAQRFHFWRTHPLPHKNNAPETNARWSKHEAPSSLGARLAGRAGPSQPDYV